MPAVPVRSLLLSLALALVPAGSAHALPPALGGLTPLAGAAACLNATGAGGCTEASGQAGATDVVAVGARVYASAANTAILAYRREADGSLTPLGCVARTAAPGCAATDAELRDGGRLAVAAATSTLYVTAGTGGQSRVLAYRLAADGRIGARVGCLSEDGTPAGCRDVAALDTPRDLALSADGRRLYTASDGLAGGLAAFKLKADGSFEDAPGAGCVGPALSAIPGCPAGPLKRARAVAVAGQRLYAAWRGEAQKTSGIETYALTAGALAGPPLDCLGANVSPDASCARTGQALTYPVALDAAPDGRSLVVGAQEGAAGAVSAYALTADGLGDRLSCATGAPVVGCATQLGLDLVHGLTLSPDGRSIYAAAGAVWALDRDPATGAATGAGQCLAPPGGEPTCAAATAMGDPLAVAVAPEGARAYVAGADAPPAVGGLATFQRELGPTCIPASLAVAPPAGSAGTRLSCSDPNGDPITIELATPAGHGTATVTPDGTATYTPATGFGGSDEFGFRATDGSVASATTRVIVGVVAPTVPPAPPPPVPAALRSAIDAIRSPVRARDLVRFTGRASGDGLTRVEIAVVRLDHGARAARGRPACRRLRASGRLGSSVPTRRPCPAAGFLTVSGTARWTFNLIRPLPRGRYVIVSRAASATAAEPRASTALRNRRTFIVR